MKSHALLLLFFMLISCQAKKNIFKNNNSSNEIILEQTLPEVNISSRIENKTYKESRQRYFDLLHTKLEVSFNFEKQQLYGNANLTMKPYFYSSNLIQLDAKMFDIHDVKISYKNIEKTLKYSYDSSVLKITLDRLYQANEIINIKIKYTANPNRIKEEGSNAITDRKGLYFINPDGKDKNKPTQIWTQGETESSSCWFPTFDNPNERCTQEITITVPNKYKTLSNGVLINSKLNNDGTRSDYWNMDKPHAPYLFMMAIGDFAVVNDKWQNKELNYYVEPKYKDDAKSIFKYTPEMLSFFSNILGVEYPWQKFSQVIVRDFVSGAMENTTAVVYGDFCQRTTRENIDENPAEEVIAHEMFHHWFGDYVTAESWSNLTLNESFADYSEYLWKEHKYGKDAAEYHAMLSERAYMAQSNYNNHPLVNFYYDKRDDMFDAHSYNKGGLILHMLRNEVGDTAFFAALNEYLTTNAYSAAEAHQLRLSFEKITGKDLNYFFNQWYFTEGHPILTFKHDFDATNKTLKINIQQDSLNQKTIYQLPFTIKYYNKNENGMIEVHSKKILINTANTDINLPCITKPIYVNYDSENIVLCKKKELEKTSENYYWEYVFGNFKERWESLNYFRNKQNNDTSAYAIMKKALEDNASDIRKRALEDILIKSTELTGLLKKIAKNDKSTLVRAQAINRLGETKDENLLSFFQQFEQDSSYAVISATINAAYNINKQIGYKIALKNKNEESKTLKNQVATIIAQQCNADDWQYIKQYAEVDNNNNFAQINNVYEYLIRSQNNIIINEGIETLKNLALQSEPWYSRNIAYSYLKKWRDETKLKLDENNLSNKNDLDKIYSKINVAIDLIRTEEKNEKLKEIYSTDVELEKK
jgi:aminopeptidase N